MKANVDMNQTRKRGARTLSTLAILTATAVLSFGCTQDFASYDDSYEPQSVDDNFPIKVVERPVQLTIEATDGGLRTRQKDQVVGFARQAAAQATTAVNITYAPSSRLAKQTVGDLKSILVHEGVPARAILVTPANGRTNAVTLSFEAKVAQTKPCGDWSENLRANQFNDSGPNFGCAFQQNFAAMVANPEDLVTPQPLDPARSAAQKSTLDGYDTGTWHTPIKDTTLSNF